MITVDLDSFDSSGIGKQWRDLTQLTVSFILREKGKRGFRYTFCQCKCGKVFRILVKNLNQTRSCRECGIVRSNRANTIHGLTKTPEHKIWRGMKDRCFNVLNPGYDDYGGRGIIVCERWLNFEDFYADMGTRPAPELEIDRIDNDGNYEPGNCRWTTREVNVNNRIRKAR